MKSLQKYITIYVKYENSDYLICFFRFKCVFLHKTLKKMILNLKFSNYRSFKNDCIFTTEESPKQKRRTYVTVGHKVKESSRHLKFR